MIKKIGLLSLVIVCMLSTTVFAETENENIQMTNRVDEEGEHIETGQILRAAAVSGAWIQASDGRWWYRHSDGSYTKNGWEYINGKWYYFDAYGWMKTGWLHLSNVWYYLMPSGAMATEWNKIDGQWYYFETSGVMATGWKQVYGKWYFLNSSGVMQTGWQYIAYMGTQKYYNYFDSNGVYVTDSDIQGCSEGYTTFKDYRYSISPNKIKYYSYCSSAQNLQIGIGCSEWNNDTSNVTKASSATYANLYFYSEQLPASNALAYTIFYGNGVWENIPSQNWPYARITVNTYYGIIGSGTIAHEVGHALGLSHRVTNKNSIMCQLGNGRLVSTVQPTDLLNLRHLY